MSPVAGLVGPTTSASKKMPRNATLDGLKYLAAGGIVLHHVAAAARAGGSPLAVMLVAVPVAALYLFFAISGYFHGELGDRGGAWLWRRIVRLAVPYAAWSVFYIAWNKSMVWHGTQSLVSGVLELVLFAGAHGVLWSLAMLVYCAIVIELFVHNTTQRRVALGVAVLATLAIYWLAPNDAIAANPLQNFIYAPRWFIAYLGGMEIRAMEAKRLPAWVYESSVIASMVAAGVYRHYNPMFSTSVNLTVETALWVFGALMILMGAVSGTKWFGVERFAWGRDYLVGVYISHVLWLEIFVRAVPPNNTMLGAPWIIGTWAFCMLMSTVTVALLRSNRVTRWAVA